MDLYNIEYEKLSLGAFLQDNSAIDRAGLNVEHYSDKTHQNIYLAMQQLMKEGAPVNLLTVTEKLPDQSVYIASLTNETFTAANIEHYSSKLKDLSRRRKLHYIGKEVSEYAKNDAIDPAELHKQLDEAFLENGTTTETTTFQDYFQARTQWDPSHYFTPDLFGGLPFPLGTTSYIGARTGRGKTATLVNLGGEAIQKNKPTLFITFELSPFQLLDRFILRLYRKKYSGIPMDNLDITPLPDWTRDTPGGPVSPTKALYYWFRQHEKETQIPTEIQQSIEQVQNYLNTGMLKIVDLRGFNLQTIINSIRRHESEVVLIDYIQKLPPEVGDETANRQQQMQRISQRIVDLSVKTNRVFIAAAQFNRGDGKDGPDVFSDSSFREAGDIEQDAHNAVGIGWEADKTQRFYKVLKARESNYGNREHKLQFEGAYCFMNEGSRREHTQKSKTKSDNSKVLYEYGA